MHISLAPLIGEGYFLQKGAMQLAKSLSRGTQELLGFARILHIIEALAENNYLEELNISGNAVPNELHTLQVDFSVKYAHN
ncbi:hypothetical protein K1719_035152 [Acacia pycnantha]|nr:hypothetical protein K1719_035152 [Acacia pycnantha]